MREIVYDGLPNRESNRTDCSVALSLTLVCQPIIGWRSALPGGPRHPAAGSVKFSLQPQRHKQGREGVEWHLLLLWCSRHIIRALAILQL